MWKGVTALCGAPLSCARTSACGVQAALGALPVRCDDARFTEALRPPLMHLCVRYLLTKRSGRVIDPVGESHHSHDCHMT